MIHRFFGGQNWVIPNPKQSFTLQTNLNSTIGNEMTLQFMENLHNQASRSFRDVVCDMGIITRMVRNGHLRSFAHRLLAIAGQMIQSNVFLPADSYPSFPYPYPIKEVSFLRLVFDMKCHLIYRAFMDLYDQESPRLYFLLCTYVCSMCSLGDLATSTSFVPLLHSFTALATHMY